MPTTEDSHNFSNSKWVPTSHLEGHVAPECTESGEILAIDCRKDFLKAYREAIRWKIFAGGKIVHIVRSQDLER
eukprot:2753511-Amphidinium_carterae.1